MSNQFFESQHSEMGLFTFYKQEEERIQSPKKHKGKKGKKRKSPRSKKKMLSLQKPPQTTKEKSVDSAKHNDSCDQFLKSVLPKLKRMELPEVSELTAREHQQAKTPLSKADSIVQQTSKIQTAPLQIQKPQSIKDNHLTQAKLSASLLPSEFVRSQFFKQERQSMNSPSFAKKPRETVRQRIRTQINNQLHKNHKNHMDFIHSAERELIIGRKLGPEAKPKERLISETRPLTEKLRFPQAKINAKSTLEGEDAPLSSSKTSKELHEANKRYFNNLMEHIYVQPEYNQTVYRILRETLKFPQVARNSHLHIKKLKTEGNSPQKRQQQLPPRSHSYYQKVTPQFTLKQKQTSSKTRNSTSVAVKGRFLVK